MRSGPRFSILVPTRNRARLLRLALRSALELRGDDYEVVVSDNCSADETRDVVTELGDTRVRYVRTPRPMNVSENLEFVLEHAQGDFVIYLCDDDALVAGTLELARETLAATSARLLAWPHCLYYYADWHDLRHRNALVAQPYSAQVVELRAHDTLAAAYRDLAPLHLPTCTNMLCERALIQRARARVPRLFPLISADIFAGVLVLAEAGSYSWADIPLTIFGRWPESIGSSLFAGRGTAGSGYVREFPEEAALRHVPLRALTATNLLAEALLRAKSALGPRLGGIELNWARYFERCYHDLVHQRTQGGDVHAEFMALHEALERQPQSVREPGLAAIRASHQGFRRSAQRRLRRLVNTTPFFGWVESLLRPTLRGQGAEVVLRGSEARFDDILECARVWDRVLLTQRVTIAAPSVTLQASAAGWNRA